MNLLHVIPSFIFSKNFILVGLMDLESILGCATALETGIHQVHCNACRWNSIFICQRLGTYLKLFCIPHVCVRGSREPPWWNATLLVWRLPVRDNEYTHYFRWVLEWYAAAPTPRGRERDRHRGNKEWNSERRDAGGNEGACEKAYWSLELHGRVEDARPPHTITFSCLHLNLLEMH